MSIDYDMMRELLDEAAPGPWEAKNEHSNGNARTDTSRLMHDARGEYIGIMHHPDAELAALAPDMAAELLRLRDRVEQVREMCLLERDAAFQETPMRAGEVKAFNICAEQLAELLEGATE